MGVILDTSAPQFKDIDIEVRSESTRIYIPDAYIGDFHRDPGHEQVVIEVTHEAIPSLIGALSLAMCYRQDSAAMANLDGILEMMRPRRAE